MTRHRLILVLPLAAGALLALPVAVVHAASQNVIAYSSSLSPSAVQIETNDSVTWSNQSENVHNLYGTSGNWPAGERYLFPGGSTSIQFYVQGTYSYTCEYHPDTMRGTVTVVDEEPSPDPSGSPSPDPSASPSTDPSASPAPTPTESVSPSSSPTESAPPSPAPSPTPTVLPTFGGGDRPASAPQGPALAASAQTPPPDSPFKPPMTILGAVAVILLFAGNPLLKPRPEPVRVPSSRPRPPRPRPGA